jgi:hypothetical protein
MLLMVLLAGLATAQSVSAPPLATANSQTETSNAAPFRIASGTFIWAEFSKSLDAGKNRAGDPVEAKTVVDLLAQGKVVLPRNTRVLGHITAVKPHTKDSPASYIAITLDRLVLEDGHELQVQLAVQAKRTVAHLFDGKDSSDEATIRRSELLGSGTATGHGVRTTSGKTAP